MKLPNLYEIRQKALAGVRHAPGGGYAQEVRQETLAVLTLAVLTDIAITLREVTDPQRLTKRDIQELAAALDCATDSGRMLELRKQNDANLRSEAIQLHGDDLERKLIAFSRGLPVQGFKWLLERSYHLLGRLMRGKRTRRPAPTRHMQAMEREPIEVPDP